MPSAINITKSAGQLIFSLKVVPGSSKTAIAGEHDGLLKIKLAAPPEKGKANKALIAYLAKKLDIKKNNIQITSGLTSTTKQITLQTPKPAEIAHKIQNLC